MPSASFSDFAILCEHLAATGSRLARTRLVSDYLGRQTAVEAEVVARWLIGRVVPEGQGRRLALSGRAVWAALEEMGIDVHAASWAGAEDFGELVRRVLPPVPQADRPLCIADLVDTFAAIATASGSGSRRQRIGLLADVLRRAAPLEAKYLAKIGIGEMRDGVQEGIVLDAIAALCDGSASEIRRAHQALGDVGRLAALAKTGGIGKLAAIAVELFRPGTPMLAQTETGASGR